MSDISKEVAKLFKESLVDLITKRVEANDKEGLSQLLGCLSAVLASNDTVIGVVIATDVAADLANTIADCFDKRELASEDWQDRSKDALIFEAFREAADQVRKNL